MANIQRRETPGGKATFRVQIRLSGHPPQSRTFERLTDARKWAASTEAAIREGRLRPQSAWATRRTFAEAINRYMQERGFAGERRTVARGKQSRLTRLLWWRDRFGALPLVEVTSDKIEAAMAELGTKPGRGGKRLSPTTIGLYLTALNHVFSVAVRKWKWLPANPCAEIDKPPVAQGRTRFLSDAERAALLEACRQSRSLDLHDVVTLFLCLGCRKRELLDLAWPDVDLARAVVAFRRTKNGKPRTVPLPGPALDILRRRSVARRPADVLVFPGRRKRTQGMSIDRAWSHAVKQAGLVDFRLHDLRHSCASYLVMSGASLIEVAEILGHRTLAMTQRYSHLSVEHTASVLNRMTAIRFGEGDGTNGEA